MSKRRFKAPSQSPIKNALHHYKRLLKQKHNEANIRRIKNCGAGGQSTARPSEEGKACGEVIQQGLTADDIFSSILSREPQPQTKH